jgi:hypothetical protein
MKGERTEPERGDRAANRDGPVGTVVGTAPREVFLRRRRAAGGPAFVRVKRGDLLIEGDRPVSGPGRPGPGMDSWRVTAVTAEVVAARHVETGRAAAWERSQVERALATGALSTSLGGFESVVVADQDGPRRRTRVVAFGDDGRRYERVYGRRDGQVGAISMLVRENGAARDLTPELRSALDEAIAGGLRERRETVERP